VSVAGYGDDVLKGDLETAAHSHRTQSASGKQPKTERAGHRDSHIAGRP
jgi:hypothetical protein